MNSIRQIQELNKRELENNISPNASWHTDYRDTAYIYIGGLPFELSEGDIITIFSQYGEPTYINLIRDKETGKSKGFAFLKYEDQRSTDLAVDNLGGAVIVGRTLKVDHTRYKKKDDDEGMDLTAPQIGDGGEEGEGRRKRRRTGESESESEEERPTLKEERELVKIIQEHDEDDPMKAFLVEEKKEEVAMALARLKDGKSSSKSKSKSKSHKHGHHHRSRRERDEGDESRHRHRRDRDEHERRRSRSRDDGREKERQSRRSEHERSEGHRERRRSARRDSRERVRGDRERDSGRERRRDS